MQIREFKPSDIEEVNDVYCDSFYSTQWPVIEHASPDLTKDIVLMFSSWGISSLVAEIDGKVAGILIGAESPTLRWDLNCLKGILKFALKFLSGRYKCNWLGRKHFLTILEYFIVSGFHIRPIPDAQVLLLCVHSKYRGKGIASDLMNAYFDFIKGFDANIKSIALCTCTAMTWQFYEAFGYKRVSEWKEHAFRYSLSDEEVTSFLYWYELSSD